MDLLLPQELPYLRFLMFAHQACSVLDLPGSSLDCEKCTNCIVSLSCLNCYEPLLACIVSLYLVVLPLLHGCVLASCCKSEPQSIVFRLVPTI